MKILQSLSRFMLVANLKLKYTMLATEQISQILPVSFVRYFLITLPR